MRSMEVDCITLSSPFPHHRSVTHIGHSQSKWRLGIAQAIRCIELDIEQYYLVDAPRWRWVYLAVVSEHGHAPHLRARTAGGEWTDLLLELPNCGRDCGAPEPPPRLRCHCCCRCGLSPTVAG